MPLEQMAHILDTDISLQHGCTQVTKRSGNADHETCHDGNPPTRSPHVWLVCAEHHYEGANHGEQDGPGKSFPRFLRRNTRAQLVLAQPCSSKQAASIAQCGHEHHHDGVSNGMPIECQWHDDARRQKRNIQHGEHGNRNMAQTAMGYLSLLMVERRFESCAGIGMGKFVGNRQ